MQRQSFHQDRLLDSNTPCSHPLVASVSPLLMLADIFIASLPNSRGPGKGPRGLRTCPPLHLPAHPRAKPSLPRLLAPSASAPLQPPHPLLLSLHQAQQGILSLNGLHGHLLSFLA